MLNAMKLPGVDPKDGKLKWYEGNTFTLCFPLQLTLMDGKKTIAPYTVYPSDVVKTRFYNRLEKELVYEFTSTNIQNNTVQLDFTEDITANFPKGDYYVEMEFIGDKNNFYVPTATDFEEQGNVRVDTTTDFSAKYTIITQTDNVAVGDGVVEQASTELISKYAQLRSAYVFPFRIYLGTQYVGNRVNVDITPENEMVVNDIVDSDGYIHFLVEAYLLHNCTFEITISSQFIDPVTYTFSFDDGIGYEIDEKHVIEIVDDVNVTGLKLGHRKVEDSISDTLSIYGNITYTTQNNVKKALIPIQLYIGESYSGKTVEVDINGSKESKTVAATGRVGVILNTDSLKTTEFNISIIVDDETTFTFVVDTSKVLPYSAVYDKDNIPTDCKYVTRCAYHNEYTRCPNCPLKKKSMQAEKIVKTLLDENINEVQVL